MKNIEEKIKEAKLKRAINIANKYWVILAVMMMIFQHYDVNPIFGQITAGLWGLTLLLGAIGFFARDDEKNKFYAEYLDKCKRIKKGGEDRKTRNKKETANQQISDRKR